MSATPNYTLQKGGNMFKDPAYAVFIGTPAIYKRNFKTQSEAKAYAKANKGRVYDMRPGKGKARIYG